MAEINSAAGQSRRKGSLYSFKKKLIRVDLTPMVDLGFLLITFFVFTTSMSQPRALKLFLPKGDIPSTHYGESTVLTVIPVGDDRVIYFHGTLDDAVTKKEYGTTNFSLKDGIGKMIRAKQQALDVSGKFTKKDMVLIIKPTINTNYKSIVRTLDEVLSNDVSHYMLIDLDNTEKDRLKQLQLLQ